jgi:hypothetical protein
VTFPHVTKRTAAAAATAALTAAATVIALAPVPALAGTSPSSASGILTSGLGIPPISAVSSNGKAEDSSLLSTPNIPDLTASVLHVFADGDQGTARASAAGLNVGGGQLIASLVTASCKPGGGNATLLNATVAGHAIPVAPPPNTTIAVPPGAGHIVAITLNKQVKNSQGGITVSAIEVQLGTGSAQKTIDISTANCAAPTAHTSPVTPISHTSPAVPAAPAPVPLRGDLPVTG